MKKLFATLLTLCLLCGACTALADMEIPNFDDMPLIVLETGEGEVDENAFMGEWVLNVAFASREYVDEATLFDTYDFVFMPYVITDGKIMQDVEDGDGEFHTREMPYVFEAGQLQGTDTNGHDFAVELLEDGNIVLSLFYPGENDTVICLSVYLVHPAE